MKEEPRELTPDDLRRACLPERYWTAGLGRIPMRCAYRAVLQRYIDHLPERLAKGVGLLFHGPYRAGKTAGAAIILKAAVAHRFTAYFLRVGELADAVIEKWLWSDGDRIETVRHRIVGVDLLVLDDLGADRNKSDFLPALFEEIVRERFDRHRVTLLTTNLSMVELRTRFSGIFQVLQECAAPVEVGGTHWHDDNVKSLKV